jgi:hypothetical protein
MGADDVRGVAELAGGALLDAFAEQPGRGIPALLDTPAVGRRERVWTAIGYLSVEHELSADSALALLRSFAYGEGIDLESAADRVLGGDGPAP